MCAGLGRTSDDVREPAFMGCFDTEVCEMLHFCFFIPGFSRMCAILSGGIMRKERFDWELTALKLFTP